MARFRGLPDEVIHGIRGAWKDLVHRMGGVDRAERVCQVSKGQISTYGSEHGDSLPPLTAIFLAERDTGKPYLTTILAGATGHHLVPHEPVAPGQLAELMAQVGAGSGKVFATYALAMADDGAVDAEERIALRRDLGEIKRAVLAAIAHLDGAPAVVVAAAEASR